MSLFALRAVKISLSMTLNSRFNLIHISDVHAEIKHLKAELQRITKERDQLKNAIENKQ